MLSVTVIAQEKTKDTVIIEQQRSYNVSELTEKPEYIDGGMEGFYSYIYKHFKIPRISKVMTARIYLSFVIEKDGSMSEIKLLRDPGYGLGREAIRVLKKVNRNKKWIPGKLNGKTIRARYNLPITVNVDDKK
ncbi:energy transducer TonB [Flavobacterium litorale]|uniref:Energy transducer TonB n=1 Tax=Flavobacterium litorale TaxID=2856519 RepID=A0ABX8VDV5_9FLAO|nr:energy transducer TonB [Flavobacterium litorale]QYJ69343.1 energy transducer TonB [Flavobacterium litorale]